MPEPRTMLTVFPKCAGFELPDVAMSGQLTVINEARGKLCHI